jgi:hypothetical protein
MTQLVTKQRYLNLASSDVAINFYHAIVVLAKSDFSNTNRDSN